LILFLFFSCFLLAIHVVFTYINPIEKLMQHESSYLTQGNEMGLSCSCNEWDGEGAAWIPDDDYSIMPVRQKRCRCESCGNQINNWSIVLKFFRLRNPVSYVEENIYGEDGEVWLAPWYLCEECADLYFSLDELGYCANPYDSMHELVMEYAEMVQELKATKGGA